jgi:hypothetical protein
MLALSVASVHDLYEKHDHVDKPTPVHAFPIAARHSSGAHLGAAVRETSDVASFAGTACGSAKSPTPYARALRATTSR